MKKVYISRSALKRLIDNAPDASDEMGAMPIYFGRKYAYTCIFYKRYQAYKVWRCLKSDYVRRVVTWSLAGVYPWPVTIL